MDWPRMVDPILVIEEDECLFDYECPSMIVSKVVRNHVRKGTRQIWNRES